MRVTPSWEESTDPDAVGTWDMGKGKYIGIAEIAEIARDRRDRKSNPLFRH